MYLSIYFALCFYLHFISYMHTWPPHQAVLYFHISLQRFSTLFFVLFCLISVMGLQRLFSATTAVVGLFISVDYGLCDEFRCRGSNIIATTPLPTVGWQGRAMWTLVYVAGIALWTLHLSLLEGNIVTPVNVIFVYFVVVAVAFAYSLVFVAVGTRILFLLLSLSFCPKTYECIKCNAKSMVWKWRGTLTMMVMTISAAADSNRSPSKKHNYKMNAMSKKILFYFCYNKKKSHQ